MARTVTLGTLKTRIRQRADKVNSTFVSDAEIGTLVDVARSELMDLLIKGEIHQFETTATITSTGTDTYALPSDHYKTLGIDYRVSTSLYVPVKEITFAERNDYQLLLGAVYGGAYGYRLVGSNIVFSPAPPTGQVYRHIYIAAPTDISASGDSTTIEGIAGWEEFIVLRAAIDIKTKEEVDHSDLDKALRDIKERIAEMSVDREPVKSIANTRFDDDDDYRLRWRRW